MKQVPLQQHIDIIQESIRQNEETIVSQRNLITFLEGNPELCKFSLGYYGNYIDIGTPTREQLAVVRGLFPGHVWKKTPSYDNDGTLNYRLDLPDCGGIRLSCQSVPPPPSCTVVEEWVDIPAKPARRELRKIVKCAVEEKE